MSFVFVMFFMFVIAMVAVLAISVTKANQLNGRHKNTHQLPPPDHNRMPMLGGRPPAPMQVPRPTAMIVPRPGAQPVYPLTPAARQACDSDITTFGTELRDLDLDVVGHPLDTDANQDYTRALDAYDSAKEHLARAAYDVDVRRVAEILEEGRFAMACVRARVNGLPLPAKRPPCFFDPAHGPSTRDITWAPQGGAARQVPACEADAQRVLVGRDPRVRMVASNGNLVPYWENRDYAPWAQGYYRRYGQDPTVRHLAAGAFMVGGASLLKGMLDDLD